MGNPDKIQFFVTAPHECSYISGREATAIFADPYTPMNPKTFSNLTEMGFRRSGDFIYKPQCASCQACIPVRVPAESFQANKNQRRVLKKNQDIRVTAARAEFRDEDYKLYEQYINGRHHDGGMHPPTHKQYTAFLLSDWSESLFFRFYLGDQLLCVAVADRLSNGLSAVYTYFDTAHASRSLGTYAILWQIQFCKTKNLQHLYLGYWVAECRKMSYKNQFHPTEQLINNQWVFPVAQQ